MPWARFDERFPGHRRIRRLSDAAFRLHVSAVCWSSEYLTDGHIPSHDLEEVSDVRRPDKAAAELVEAGRWHLPDEVCPSENCWPITDGWLIHDYLDYNPSRAEVEEKREKDADRKRRGRTSAKRGSPNGVRADSEGTPSGVTPESFRTDPVVTNVTTTRPEPAPVASNPDAAQTARTLLAEWIDNCQAPPVSRVKGQVAKLLGELLAEGQPYPTVRAGLQRWHQKRLNPAALPSVVHEVAQGPAVNTRPSNMDGHLALVAQIESGYVLPEEIA